MENWKLWKRIFNNSTTGAQKPKWISPRSQVAICSGLVSIQVEFWCFLLLFVSMDIKEKGEQPNELFCSIGFEMNNIHIPESTRKKPHCMPICPIFFINNSMNAHAALALSTYFFVWEFSIFVPSIVLSECHHHSWKINKMICSVFLFI